MTVLAFLRSNQYKINFYSLFIGRRIHPLYACSDQSKKYYQQNFRKTKTCVLFIELILTGVMRDILTYIY